MATGRNPYDNYRGREVLSRAEQDARESGSLGSELEAWRTFLGWQFQQTGGGIVWKFYVGQRPRQQTPLQKFLELPVLSNIVGRSIRSTTYGEIEALRDIQRKALGAETWTRQQETDAVDDRLYEYQRTGVTPSERDISVAAAEIVERFHPDEDLATKRTKHRNLVRKLRIGIARGNADPVTDVVLSAVSNAQKTTVIIEAFKGQSDEVLAQWLRDARQAGVVSDNLYADVVKARRSQIPEAPVR